MDRPTSLPGGCKNLSDSVRVVTSRGELLHPMTLAEAQALATKQKVHLILITSCKGPPVFRLSLQGKSHGK